VNDFSKLVMARDFWCEALESQNVTSLLPFTAVHANPREFISVVETFWRRAALVGSEQGSALLLTA